MSKKDDIVIKGFKGFDKDFKCRGFQYEVGEEYETDKAKVCESGFHSCENPLDVLSYYHLCDSEYGEVEASGKIDKHDQDSKVASTKIKIKAKLSLGDFIKAAVSIFIDKYKPSGDSSQLAASGHYSKLAASGVSSQLAASGDSSQLAASGDSSQLEMTGTDSVGAAIGMDNHIKGVVGDWITLAEWKHDDKTGRYVPVCVKSVKIDGKKIKADTWYKLKGGKFVEVQ